MPLHIGIGRRIRAIREEELYSQDQVAARARNHGLSWTRSTVAKIERGGREVTLAEFLLLPSVLACTVGRLLPEVGWVEVADGARVKAQVLLDVLAGVVLSPGDVDLPGQRAARSKRDAVFGSGTSGWLRKFWHDIPIGELTAAIEAMSGEAEHRAARQIGVHHYQVAVAARKLWGRNLTEERDHRLSLEGRPASRAERGHVTRRLLDELRRALSPQAAGGEG